MLRDVADPLQKTAIIEFRKEIVSFKLHVRCVCHKYNVASKNDQCEKDSHAAIAHLSLNDVSHYSHVKIQSKLNVNDIDHMLQSNQELLPPINISVVSSISKEKAIQ